MNRIFTAIITLLISANSAYAVTITPGNLYRGDYVISGLDADSFLPVISIDSPVRILQFTVFFTHDLLDSGEGFNINMFEGGLVPPVGIDTSISFTNTSIGPVGILGLSKPPDVNEISMGKITIGSTFGSFNLDRLVINGVVDATVMLANGAPLTTGLAISAEVTNFSIVVPPPPPGPPSPSPVPLPAALPLFSSGLTVMSLIGWRRCRKIS